MEIAVIFITFFKNMFWKAVALNRRGGGREIAKSLFRNKAGFALIFRLR